METSLKGEMVLQGNSLLARSRKSDGKVMGQGKEASRSKQPATLWEAGKLSGCSRCAWLGDHRLTYLKMLFISYLNTYLNIRIYHFLTKFTMTLIRQI